MNFVLTLIGGEKKGEPLDVIPMGMADEEVDLEVLIGKFPDQIVAELTDPGAGIEHQNVVAAADFNARGISPVAHRRDSRCGNRTACPPEPDFHHGPTFRFCNCSRTVCRSSSS